MISRLTTAFPITALAVALFASSTPAQVRGMHASGSAPRPGVSFRSGGRTGVARRGEHRASTSSSLLPFPYLYPGYDYEPVAPEAPPVEVVAAPPAPPPVPASAPVDSLLLENHGGQWVRVPTGGQLAALSPSVQPDSVQASAARPEIAAPKAPPLALPRAVLVFRDGHREEIEKYIIQGDLIYASGDYWSTGSWTKEIPISTLDVPATLKLNEERGGKFNLPSAPNQIVIRF